MADDRRRRRGLELHWQILIGLVAGLVVGLAINLVWGPYTWGALGVGDPGNYRAARAGERADALPKSAGPALEWLADAAASATPGPGSATIDPPNNAYTARVIEYVTRSLRDADAELIDADGARAWLASFAASVAADGDDAIRAGEIDLAADEELRQSVAALTASFELDDPNASAGFAALVPRYVYILSDMVGDLFLAGLRFIAVPIVLFSLIVGVSSLNDTAKLGRIGGKTIAIYLATTALAITVGLVLANLVAPGRFVSAEAREDLLAAGMGEATSRIQTAQSAQPNWWSVIVDIVPTNPFRALAEGEMLQVVFFALAIGIALTLIPREKARPVIAFADGMTEVIIKLVHILMRVAPLAVFVLIASVMADMGLDVLRALLAYALVVIGGLAIMMLVVYPIALRMFASVGYARFFRAIAPAQLLAFSSSSSSATLPVTMECCEERLGASEEVTSFVVPVGATINMDGTALYQGVAAVFIAQLYGLQLSLGDQLQIVLIATLASIGTAGVPGVGMIMLVIVMQQLGFSAEVMAGGIAIIFGIDRLLDMCRTTCNVTGDCAVCGIVAASERALLTEEEVEQRRALAEARGLDEHPHEGTGNEYGVALGSTHRPVDVPDQPGHRKRE